MRPSQRNNQHLDRVGSGKAKNPTGKCSFTTGKEWNQSGTTPAEVDDSGDLQSNKNLRGSLA
jgi:hypothetical protein